MNNPANHPKTLLKDRKSEVKVVLNEPVPSAWLAGGQTFFDNRIWLDTNEAANFLRITVNALRIRIWRKQVIAHKFGNRLRFKRIDLDKYMRLYR